MITALDHFPDVALVADRRRPGGRHRHPRRAVHQCGGGGSRVQGRARRQGDHRHHQPCLPRPLGPRYPHGSSGAQEIAKGLSAGAHVVKAFNTIFGHVLAKSGRLDAFIAADDAEAKASVSTFLESLGLRPLDVGGLRMAQTLEALGLMMIGLAKNGAGTWDIAMNVDIDSNRL